jgi:hypothetical protein
MMNYLKATKDNVPSMSANDTSTIKWHVDATALCHPQGHEKSHWSHYDSWLWYHLLHLYKTKSQYLNFHQSQIGRI